MAHRIAGLTRILFVEGQNLHIIHYQPLQGSLIFTCNVAGLRRILHSSIHVTLSRTGNSLTSSLNHKTLLLDHPPTARTYITKGVHVSKMGKKYPLVVLVKAPPILCLGHHRRTLRHSLPQQWSQQESRLESTPALDQLQWRHDNLSRSVPLACSTQLETTVV